MGHRASSTGHNLENMIFLEPLQREYQVSDAETPKGGIGFCAQCDKETRYI